MNVLLKVVAGLVISEKKNFDPRLPTLDRNMIF